jgi:RimJ/RimL family protein N-acetyltransferase
VNIHAAVQTAVGIAGIRDLDPADIDHILVYWYTSSVNYLDYLGIDRSRLGPETESRRRFQVAIPTGNSDQQNLAFALTLDEAFVGYTLLNRYAPLDNYSHWHITNPSLRRAGLSTALYPYRIKTYFESVPIERLIHQTRTRNVGVNRMLDKYVPVAETRYIENPDGVALPGEFNVRYVFRSDVPSLFAKL